MANNQYFNNVTDLSQFNAKANGEILLGLGQFGLGAAHFTGGVLLIGTSITVAAASYGAATPASILGVVAGGAWSCMGAAVVVASGCIVVDSLREKYVRNKDLKAEIKHKYGNKEVYKQVLAEQRCANNELDKLIAGVIHDANAALRLHGRASRFNDSDSERQVIANLITNNYNAGDFLKLSTEDKNSLRSKIAAQVTESAKEAHPGYDALKGNLVKTVASSRARTGGVKVVTQVTEPAKEARPGCGILKEDSVETVTNDRTKKSGVRKVRFADVENEKTPPSAPQHVVVNAPADSGKGNQALPQVSAVHKPQFMTNTPVNGKGDRKVEEAQTPSASYIDMSDIKKPNKSFFTGLFTSPISFLLRKNSPYRMVPEKDNFYAPEVSASVSTTTDKKPLGNLVEKANVFLFGKKQEEAVSLLAVQ